MTQKPDQTPSQAKSIKAALRLNSKNLRVALPAKVTKYYPGTAVSRPMIDAQPLLKEVMQGFDGADSLPEITNIPVVWQASSECFMRFPLKVGDGVLLLFSDRSLDKWLSTGGEVDPQDTRIHALSDAIAIPGFFSHTTPIPDTNEDDAVFGFVNSVTGQSAKVRIATATGDIILENDALAKVHLGGVAVEPALKGTSFCAFFDLHAHVCPIFGASGVPTVPATTAPLIRSTKVTVDG